MTTNRLVIPILALFGIAIAFLYYLHFNNTEKRIAYVLTGEIYDGFEMTKEKSKEFESLQIKRKIIIDSLTLRLQLISQELRLSKEKDDKKLMEGRMIQEDLRTKQSQFSEDEQQIKSALNEQIWKQINQYLTDYGKANGYTYILGASGDGSLMYAAEGDNITKPALAFINDKYKGKK